MTKLDDTPIPEGSIHYEQQNQVDDDEIQQDENTTRGLGTRMGGIGEKKVIIFGIISLCTYFTVTVMISMIYKTPTLLLFLIFCPIPPIFWLIILYWIENRQDAYLSTLIESFYIGIGATLWLFAINATLVLCNVLIIIICLFWLDVTAISWILLISIYCFITPLTIVFTITFCCFIRLSRDFIVNKYSALLTGVAISLGISLIFSISDLLYRQYSYTEYYSDLKANDYYYNSPDDLLITSSQNVIFYDDDEHHYGVEYIKQHNNNNNGVNINTINDYQNGSAAIVTTLTDYVIHETTRVIIRNTKSHHITNNLMEYLTIGFIEYAILDPIIKIGCGAWIGSHLASFRFKVNPTDPNPSYWKIMGVPFLLLVAYNLTYRVFGGGSSLLFETFSQLNYQQEFISHLIVGMVFGGVVVMYVFIEKMRLISELKDYLMNYASNIEYEENEDEYNEPPISLSSNGSLILNMVSLSSELNSDSNSDGTEEDENDHLLLSHDHSA